MLDLAKLARISIDDNEAESLSHEFDAILSYFEEIKKLDHKSSTYKALPCREDSAVVNMMREDNESHESGIYTKKILEQAPSREGDYIKVKKIL